MPRFMREMLEFVDLGDADVTAIRRSAPIVLREAERLAAALYERFLAWPRSARFFLRGDGAVDVERLERRKHSLTRWLRETAEAATTREFSYYLLTVGLSHSHRAHGPGGEGLDNVRRRVVALYGSEASVSLTRTAGETAPIMFTGAVFYRKIEEGNLFAYRLSDQCMALSMHLYTLSTQVPNVKESIPYATAVVLLGSVLMVNATAIVLRVWLRNRKKW